MRKVIYINIYIYVMKKRLNLFKIECKMMYMTDVTRP